MITKQNLSADTLFHFTSTFENLMSILINDFFPRYSIEDWNMLNSIEKGIDDQLAIPMVCFCDIPLSQIKYHISTYGKYGIGLIKNWGVKNKITPILYCHYNSFTTEYLARIRVKLEESDDLTYDLADLLKFTKPCKGKLPSKNKINVNFYDEREWRFVPSKEIRNYKKENNEPIRVSLYKNEYIKNGKVNYDIINLNNDKIEKFKLVFTPDDIKYIIVKSENERLQTAKNIIEIKGYRFSYKSVQLLTTKIISVEQIINDF